MVVYEQYKSSGSTPPLYSPSLSLIVCVPICFFASCRSTAHRISLFRTFGAAVFVATSLRLSVAGSLSPDLICCQLATVLRLLLCLPASFLRVSCEGLPVQHAKLLSCCTLG